MRWEHIQKKHEPFLWPWAVCVDDMRSCSLPGVFRTLEGAIEAVLRWKDHTNEPRPVIRVIDMVCGMETRFP